MANGSILNTNDKNISLYRTYTQNADLSTTQYLPATKIKVGINNGTPDIANNNLDYAIPITDGTVNDDGSNTFIGSDGGDNSTANIITYKEGAGVTDLTSQNLIANDTSVTKIWTIADLTTGGANCVSTKYIANWLYILDSVTLAKFLTAGTALQLRIGADTTANYYSRDITASELSVGWNWICDNELLSTWDITGTPGTLNDFAILITTNNATDTFIAGDVVYDLLRQWESSDLVKDFVTGYPTFDFVNNEISIRGYLNSLQANGFLINGLGTFNEDTAPLMTGEDTFTGESKSGTDEFIFVIKNQIL